MNAIKDTVKRFILSTSLPGESPDNLRGNTPLQTSGILDSLAMLGLVSFVEQEFGIELDVYDTSVDHFNSVDQIASTVAHKLAARGSVSVAT